MEIAIVDYGAGNVRSLQFALERIGYKAVLTSNAQCIEAAEKVIFPGQGAAGSAMEKLRQHGLDVLIPQLQQPVLGICLGMQLFCHYSEENNTSGLDIMEGTVKRFPSSSAKVPQMGWNQITNLQSPLFAGISENSYMYLVHSYYVPLLPQTIAQSEYGFPYSVAVRQNNFFGVQFHPEKSGRAGQQLLQNFLNF